MLQDYQCFEVKKENYPLIRDSVIAAAERLGVQKLARFELGFEEVMVNIINHSKSEKVYLKLSPTLPFTVEVIDFGVPFNPLRATETPTSAKYQAIDTATIGGLGLGLIKKTFPKASYQEQIIEGVVANHLILLYDN